MRNEDRGKIFAYSTDFEKFVKGAHAWTDPGCSLGEGTSDADVKSVQIKKARLPFGKRAPLLDFGNVSIAVF
jgi:hypothetical protein